MRDSGLQFHATVSGWYTQQIYASNCGKRFLSKSCDRFTISGGAAFIRVTTKQAEGSGLMNKAQKDTHIDTLNFTWQLSLNICSNIKT